MKFSNDAMRDVLMFLEENIKYEECGTFGDKRKTTYNINMIIDNEYFTDLFSKHKYSKDELQYTIEKMIEGNILTITGTLNTYYQITDISFYGIQLLEKIRPETIWEKTKNIANKVGNHTLSFIEDTAQKIAVTATATLVSNIINSNNPK